MEADAQVTLARKDEHLEPFRRGGVPARQATTWLECVGLVHQALPELNHDDIDTTCAIAGKQLAAPVFITGMTGGSRQAGTINRSLARVADELGLAFGLGSGRAMLEHPQAVASYQVRDCAPRVFLAWNLGGCQLLHTPLDTIKRALDRLAADAICIHLNPAQELAQPEGDRDFRGILPAIEKLVAGLERPVIVKECGCGIGREVGRQLAGAGVEWLDVSGCGGTSWVGVEVQRQGERAGAELQALWDWGIPTAAAVAEQRGNGLQVIASGGIRTGLDVARALVLGARLAGVAAPVLQAYFRDGEDGCRDYLAGLVAGLRRVMLLCGCADLERLHRAPRVLAEPLAGWLRQRLAGS